jgi:hypothetical protein
MVPPEGEGGGICTALTFRRRGPVPRTGIIMPMRSFDEGADAPEPASEAEPTDPNQTDAFTEAFPDPDGEEKAA